MAKSTAKLTLSALLVTLVFAVPSIAAAQTPPNPPTGGLASITEKPTAFPARATRAAETRPSFETTKHDEAIREEVARIERDRAKAVQFADTKPVDVPAHKSAHVNRVKGLRFDAELRAELQREQLAELASGQHKMADAQKLIADFETNPRWAKLQERREEHKDQARAREAREQRYSDYLDERADQRRDREKDRILDRHEWVDDAKADAKADAKDDAKKERADARKEAKDDAKKDAQDERRAEKQQEQVDERTTPSTSKGPG